MEGPGDIINQQTIVFFWGEGGPGGVFVSNSLAQSLGHFGSKALFPSAARASAGVAGDENSNLRKMTVRQPTQGSLAHIQC